MKHNENDIKVTEVEKRLIRERIKNSKPEDGRNWNKIKDSFNLD